MASGRRESQVFEVEAELVGRGLRGLPPGPILEVGSGVGRLLATIAQSGRRLVATDLELASLARGRAAISPDAEAGWAVATGEALPFRDAAFAAVVMVRVYHRFGHPQQALDEAGRVLAPGGRLVMSVNPSHSVRSVYLDVWAGLTGGTRVRSSTFSTRPESEVEWGRYPGRVARFWLTRTRLGHAGLRILNVYSLGLEELPLFRRLPAAAFQKLASLESIPGFPTFLVVAERAVGDPPAVTASR
jgi:SAM-dependent methyltransferase